MWTWLSRVFGSQGAAGRAEAEGRIEDAARLYLERGNVADAVRVLLRAGETARTLEERRAFLVRAYGIARTDEHRREARKGLCLVTLAEAEAAAPRTEDDRRRVQEAADDLESMGLYREAGRAWAMLEDREAVARVLALAGDVDGLEKVTGDREASERNSLRRRAAVEGFDAMWRSGDRAGAVATLTAWVSAHGDDHEARSTLDRHVNLLLRDGRFEAEHDGARTVYVGRFPVTLGREADVVLRGASVSRRHVTIAQTGDRFEASDAGSRSGTTLDGVPLGAPLALRPGAALGLGADLSLRVQAAPDAGSLSLEIERGMDRGRRLVLVAGSAALACGAVRFEPSGPVLTPAQPVSLNGQKVALPFTLARGDRIEAGGRTLHVVG